MRAAALAPKSAAYGALVAFSVLCTKVAHAQTSDAGTDESDAGTPVLPPPAAVPAAAPTPPPAAAVDDRSKTDPTNDPHARDRGVVRTVVDAVSAPKTNIEERREGRQLLPKSDAKGGHFEFGSYGRVNVGSDLRGGTGRDPNIVAHGSRLEAASYAELEFRREDTFSEKIRTRIVTTLALFPPFFHFSGKIDNAIAVRQLYAQAAYGNVQLWVGSRMYRGDDIYLLNWWPLDNQNTVGGGAGGKIEKTDTFVSVHAGMQRLDNPYQYQTIPSPNPYGVGSSDTTYLDRPRTIQTFKVTQFFRNTDLRKYFNDEKKGFKAALYGELHEIGSGVRRNTDINVDEKLPADFGWLLGAQLTYYTGNRDTFASLFVRHASGLATYDPLSYPLTFNNKKTTSGASENLIAASVNYEKGPLALLAAGYLRFVRDAGDAPSSYQKYDEGIVIARPQFFFTDNVAVAVEGSYQARRYAGPQLNSTDGSPLTASLVRGSIMPFFSPSGRGSFRKPTLGVLYTMTGRSSGARSLYTPDDVFARRSVEHYAGFTVEWWFNQSSYP